MTNQAGICIILEYFAGYSDALVLMGVHEGIAFDAAFRATEKKYQDDAMLAISYDDAMMKLIDIKIDRIKQLK